ncbi:MAG TPA: SDR family oxidoreductase [Rhizobiaceae bacterium]|nr:SDR family oxidoreductase [Rhizobiaceae bacterium]
MTSLDGKKVLIFGGSRGIGLGVAKAALDRGAEVFIVGRSSEKLNAAKKALGKNAKVHGIAADMTKEADVARAFKEAGAIDHFVTTAGTPPPNDAIGEIDIDATRRFIDEKMISSMTLAKHASKALKRGGSMTFTSGINKDKPPVPGGSVVAAVAQSFDAFARALALELGPTRVNVVSPGWVDTPMFDEIVGDAKHGYFEELAARLPSGRVAKAEDVAPAYIYLMESDFTTGETVHIDGGHRLI